MQIHIMTIARDLRLRYVPSRPIELEAGVNLRSKYDFIMHPETREVSNIPVSGTASHIPVTRFRSLTTGAA
jgi:hypothetical protein